MDRTGVLLRRAETQPDAHAPAGQWSLSQTGRRQAAELASTDSPIRIETILSSPETKAIETSTFFSDSLGTEVIIVPGLEELRRESGPTKTMEDCDISVQRLFSRRESALSGWETAAEALGSV